MDANKMPVLPEAAFRLMWKRGAYYVDKPEIGDTDVYTADQMRAFGCESAVLGFSQGFDAGYLAGLEAAKTMIGEMQEYKPALQRCRPAKTGYIAFMGKKSATLEGEEYGWINTGTTLTNLTALEQEAKK